MPPRPSAEFCSELGRVECVSTFLLQMSEKFEPPSESKDEADPCESEPCSKCSRTLQLICARCSFVSGLPMHSRSLFILEPELKFQGPHCVHMTDVFYKSMLTVFKHRVNLYLF